MTERFGGWSGARRGVTRRRIMGSGLAAGAGLGALLTVGCGDDDDDDTPGTTATTGGASPTAGTDATPAGSPVVGGVMKRALTGDPNSFDLHSEISTTVVQVMQPVYNGLLTADPAEDGGILADLAESVPESPDGLTYVFKLNPGVTFHDGSPLTAEDVIANYEWMREPPSGSTSSRQRILAVIDKMEAPDDSTVTFTLKAPSASFLLNNSVPYVAIGRKSQLDAEGNLRQNPNGTGPFRMEKYEPGSILSLVRNENYFKSGYPYLDGIDFAILRDRKTLLENYYQGNIDLYLAQPDELPEIESRIGDKVTIQVTESNQRNHVFMNTTRAPFNDIRVRRALSIGLDRSVARDVMGGGMGTAIASYMHPKGSWALPESDLTSVDGYTEEGDLAAARALLDEAGVPEGTAINLVYRTLFEATGVYMVDQLNKLGFDVTAQSLDGAAVFEAANTTNFDVFIWTAAPALDDPDAVMGDIGVSSAPRNWSKIVVPEADAAFEKQSSELDAAARKALVNEADKALIENFASIVLNFDAYRYTYYEKVKNKQFVLTDIYVNQRYEDVWLAQS